MTKHQWFESWFDTDYYHLLYQHRDALEAAAFIRQIVRFLDPESDAYFCDLACGNGRHSQVIAEMGYQVKGLDLSQNNIQIARTIDHPQLTFQVHDMRMPFGEDTFDYVLNLFTSFGYFESDMEHQATIENMSAAIKSGGNVVIDYLNVHQVEDALVHSSKTEIGEIDFYIRRLTSATHIFKEIKVEDAGQSRYYEERVRKFDLNDFNEMFSKADLELVEVFGDYHLSPFEASTSSRLIMVATKK